MGLPRILLRLWELIPWTLSVPTILSLVPFFLVPLLVRNILIMYGSFNVK